MAIGLATAGVQYLRWTAIDFYSHIGKGAIPLLSSSTDTNIENIISGMQAVSKTAIYKAEWGSRPLTGLAVPSDAGAARFNGVLDVLVLAFTGADAANPARLITRTVEIPGPDLSKVETGGDPGVPDFTQTDLAALITLLAAHLAYVDGSGAPQNGLSFTAAESSFVQFGGTLLP